MKTKRSEAFFGLHFDFHAVADTAGIGTVTRAEDIAKWLDTVRPEYVQIDTKGHPGYASFRSRFGDVAPGLVGDSHLKPWREETEKRGIALIAHHSGIYDIKACADHPDWAVTDRDGTPHGETTDMTGPYAATKMIPQLKELAGDYHLDGAWVDGDIWQLCENYRPAFLERFARETGYTEIDPDPNSPSHNAFRRFILTVFGEYVDGYIRAVQEEYPDFEMTSNWYSSTNYAVPPLDALNFLSGDANVTSYARMESRCFAPLGKPWDIMLWASPEAYITPDKNYSPVLIKHIDTVCREAAMILAQGGGIQIVNGLTNRGELRMTDLPLMKRLADFARDRRKWCFRSVPTKDIAILYSEYDRLFRSDRIGLDYSGAHELCDPVLDSGLPAGVVYDAHVLDGSADAYPLIILPGTRRLEPAVIERLKQYVSGGGKLIAAGADAALMFADIAGVTPSAPLERIVQVESGEDYMYGVKGRAVTFVLNGAAEMIPCHDGLMSRTAPRIVCTAMANYGKGKIALVGWDMWDYYLKWRGFSERDNLARIIAAMEIAPTAYLEDGCKRVEIVPARQNGELLVNVINATEYYETSSQRVPDGVPPLCGLTVAIRTDRAPRAVWLEPEHRLAEFSFDGVLHVSVDRLNLHTVIVPEF